MCTHLMFQNMRLGEHLQTPRIKPQGEGLTWSCRATSNFEGNDFRPLHCGSILEFPGSLGSS